MSRPTLTIVAITPQQAGWDATVQANCDALEQFVSGQPFAPKEYTVASGAGQLPAAASYERCLAMVTDGTSGKGPLVYSDGTNWLYCSDDSIAL